MPPTAPTLTDFASRSTAARVGRAATALLLLAALPAFAAETEEWKVPPAAAAVANPVAVNEASITAGRNLYVQNCLICHGAAGLGDGEGAAFLTPKPASLNLPATTSQSDGAIFYKLCTGRTVMPPWKPLLSDEKIWQLVIYLRSLAPKTEAAGDK